MGMGEGWEGRREFALMAVFQFRFHHTMSFHLSVHSTICCVFRFQQMISMAGIFVFCGFVNCTWDWMASHLFWIYTCMYICSIFCRYLPTVIYNKCELPAVGLVPLIHCYGLRIDRITIEKYNALFEVM